MKNQSFDIAERQAAILVLVAYMDGVKDERNGTLRKKEEFYDYAVNLYQNLMGRKNE